MDMQSDLLVNAIMVAQIKHIHGYEVPCILCGVVAAKGEFSVLLIVHSARFKRNPNLVFGDQAVSKCGIRHGGDCPFYLSCRACSCTL